MNNPNACNKWTKPKKFDCNIAVIGAGAGGLVASYIAAAVKAKVVLIEKHQMGGDCLNTGCVPSKALIQTTRLLAKTRRSHEFGIRDIASAYDFGDIMARVQRIVKTIAPHDSIERYTQLGVDVIQGNAKLISPWDIEITTPSGGTQHISSASVIIAAGARPFVPAIPGLENIGYLTSDNVWDLREQPKRLLVLGGGPIGCELAQCFVRLGVQVTLVEMAPRLLIREDIEISEQVAAKFCQEGIDLRLGHTAQQIITTNGKKILVAEHHGKTTDIAFDQLLLAIGRTANTEGYGLENIGVTLSARKTIQVDGFLATNFSHIFACGDVAGPYQFTHTAAHQAWYATVNALFGNLWKLKADYSIIPWATFTEPEVARVGLNEQEAKQQGIAYEINRYDFADLDRAIADNTTEGFVKVLTRPGKDKILGVTIVGEHAGDLIAEFVLAMKYNIGLNKILGTLHIYPTLAEANKYVAGVWKKKHAPNHLLALLERYHRWRRG